jgi:hypothetical protein
MSPYRLSLGRFRDDAWYNIPEKRRTGYRVVHTLEQSVHGGWFTLFKKGEFR